MPSTRSLGSSCWPGTTGRPSLPSGWGSPTAPPLVTWRRAPPPANLIWGFAQLGFDEDAAVISGATFAGFFQMVYMDPPITAMMEAVRRRMGESRYDQAYARGAAMGHEEAVVFAMGSCDRVLALEEPAASGESLEARLSSDWSASAGRESQDSAPSQSRSALCDCAW